MARPCGHLSHKSFARVSGSLLFARRFGGLNALHPLSFLFEQVIEFNNKGTEFFRVLLGGDLRRQLHQSLSFLGFHQIIPSSIEFELRPMSTLDITETIKGVQTPSGR